MLAAHSASVRIAVAVNRGDRNHILIGGRINRFGMRAFITRSRNQCNFTLCRRLYGLLQQ